MKITESPWEKLSGQIILDIESFVQHVKDFPGGREDISEISRIQRHFGRPTLGELFTAGTRKQERNSLIRLAHGKHGYRLMEISKVVGVHYTTVSKVINSDKN